LPFGIVYEKSAGLASHRGKTGKDYAHGHMECRTDGSARVEKIKQDNNGTTYEDTQNT
jgi:hypothetical protein